MAVMRKELKDITELGPTGIIREALKLYVAHFKVYVLIQVTLMLPLAILMLVFVFAQYLPLRAGPLRSLQDVLFFGDLQAQVGVMVVWIAGCLVFQAAVSLSHSTTLFSLGLHYAGQPVSFVDAVCAVTPRLWMRLVLTAIYVNVFPCLIVPLIIAVGRLHFISYGWSDNSSLDSGDYSTSGNLLLQHQLLSPYSIAMMVLPFVGGFSLAIVLRISSGVSVLDEDYGWAAMRKGLKLLDGRGNVAILLQVLWTVPAIIEIGFVAALIFLIRHGGLYFDLLPGLSLSALALSSFTAVAFLACTTFFWELRSLCAGLSVLKKDYGWAAVKKGLKVLEGKGNVAIFLHVLWTAPAIIEIGFVATLVFLLRNGGSYVDLSTSTRALLSLTVVAFLAWTTFFWQLRSLCTGVQYVSLNSYHDESFSDSPYEKRTIPVEGSERFGEESKVPLLKGALV